VSIKFFIYFKVNAAISDGLTITQFPAAIAYTMGAIVVRIGKFQEPITAITPSGS
jgi:hypothetical protein